VFHMINILIWEAGFSELVEFAEFGFTVLLLHIAIHQLRFAIVHRIP
jgi:hypothetical protein